MINLDAEEASLDLAFEVSEYFDVDVKMAEEYIREIGLALLYGTP